MNKLKENEHKIQGLEHYSIEEIKQIATEYINTAVLYSDAIEDFKIIDMNIYGSRNRGTAREDSDLDIVFEYEGDLREDSLYNLLNDEEEPLMFDDIVVDFNPISAQRSGNMSSFLQRSKEYDKKMLSEDIWNTDYVKKLEQAIEKIKKEIPEIKFSKVIDSKYSGPRSKLTLNNLKTHIYYDGDFYIIGDKYNSYSGTIKQIIKYLKKYL